MELDGPTSLEPHRSHTCVSQLPHRSMRQTQKAAFTTNGCHSMHCAFASVLAVATWDRERSDPEYRDGLQCDKWEVVVSELVFD